jgi:cell division protein FtsL
MSRLHILLLAALLACALSVINATYQQRRIFIALEHARSRARQLRQQTAQLQYQQRALSKAPRIETAAINRLGMRPVNADATQYLIDIAESGVMHDGAQPPAAGERR